MDRLGRLSPMAGAGTNLSVVLCGRQAPTEVELILRPAGACVIADRRQGVSQEIA